VWVDFVIFTPLLVVALNVAFVVTGAWAIPTALWERSQQGVSRAASEGYSVLERGGSALDAVESAVRVLEAIT
jgi:beta-aspartyl-peptidase (threonine type)